MDKLKCLYLEQFVLDDLVRELNNKKELAKTKSDIHEYLDLTIDFSGRHNLDDPNKKGQAVFTMNDYIDDIVNSAPPDMGGTTPDSARSKLFTVHKTSPRLGTA